MRVISPMGGGRGGGSVRGMLNKRPIGQIVHLSSHVQLSEVSDIPLPSCKHGFSLIPEMLHFDLKL